MTIPDKYKSHLKIAGIAGSITLAIVVLDRVKLVGLSTPQLAPVSTLVGLIELFFTLPLMFFSWILMYASALTFLALFLLYMVMGEIVLLSYRKLGKKVTWLIFTPIVLIWVLYYIFLAVIAVLMKDMFT